MRTQTSTLGLSLVSLQLMKAVILRKKKVERGVSALLDFYLHLHR